MENVVSFTLEFLGGEVGSNRTLLDKAGVKCVGFSYHRLTKRGLPKDIDNLIKKRVPAGMCVHLHPGLPDAFDDDLIPDFAAEYEEFAVRNASGIETIQEIDRGTPLWRHQQRKGFYDDLPESMFRPVWHKADGYSQLQQLAERYETVAIPDETIQEDTTLAARIQGLKQMYSTSFHAMGCARPDNLRQIPFDSASTMAWLTPQMRGETVVWDGNRLVRYPKTQKDQARKRHRMTFSRAGFDPDLIAQDDYDEVIAATIWAYQQLEANVSERRGGDGRPPFTVIDGEGEVVELADKRAESSSREIAATTENGADNRVAPVRHQPTPREPSERATLPTLNLITTTVTEQGDHGAVVKEVGVPTLGHATLRQCNTCFVATQCPAFKADSECAFNLPIEVRTKDQLKGLLQAIIEMQGQRVAFARFTEELNGGYPDPNVSSEMDRLFKLVKNLKDLDENKAFIQVTAERTAAGGLLSALFGERAAVTRDLPGGGLDPDQTNKLISGSLE